MQQATSEFRVASAIAERWLTKRSLLAELTGSTI